VLKRVDAQAYLPNTVGSLQDAMVSETVWLWDDIDVLYGGKVTARNRISFLLGARWSQKTVKAAVKTYPLVKTFNSDVLPHAPSPLSNFGQPRSIPRCSEMALQIQLHLRKDETYRSTSLRCTDFVSPQSGIAAGRGAAFGDRCIVSA
jgi:hypothetical protein